MSEKLTGYLIKAARKKNLFHLIKTWERLNSTSLGGEACFAGGG
jgi:hypothetical protein